MKKAILILLLACAMPAYAQMEIKITSLRSALWPQIELDFTLSCAGQLQYIDNKSYLRLTEDGVEIKDYTLYCPPWGYALPITCAIVLDASANMISLTNAAVDDANDFVNLLDGVQDSCAVFCSIRTTP